MRRLIFVFLILIVTMSILWIFAGRQISQFVDQYKIAEVTSQSLQSIGYEGSGDGGTLLTDDHRLTLSPINPHIGSTKENELALASAGKVFAFGPLRSSESLAANVESSDTALLTRQRSYLAWPSFNAAQLTWNRTEYYRFTWKKQNGASLEMLWSVGEDKNATSLIRIDISNAVR